MGCGVATAGGALVVYQWAVARPLWLDEQMIAINVRDRGFVDLAGPLALAQSAPYGWLALERLAWLAFGSGERALRLVPLLFGLATIGTALWLGRRCLDAWSTSILVLLCSTGQWISYSFVELKHYSADACFGLLLPALAAWSVETDRVALWWIVAAVSQAFGNGGLFVTPFLACAIVALVFERRGAAAALRAAAPGVVWAALFVINYLLVLRPVQTSEFLQSYWQLRFPPTANGVVATAMWIAGRLVPFAVKPGGTRVGWLLWVAAAAGFALARERARLLALMFVTVPLSGFLLTTLHFVPFFERLVLWIVPAMYVGVAMLADLPVVQAFRPAGHARAALKGCATAVAVAVALVVTGDITYVGLDDLRARPAATNHRLDDRSAVRWLAAREQPGDVWVTTHLALPAIWWYAPKTSAGIVEVAYVEPGPDCQPDALAIALANALGRATRVLVFTGFHFDDAPTTFDDLLIEQLTATGQLTAYRGFGEVSRAAIVDRRLASRRNRGPQMPGCVAARLARRW